MDARISASTSDQGTEHLAALLRPRLQSLSATLCAEYGGPMAHLWIDLELSPADADRRPARAFRFQKRVAIPRELRAFGAREFINVGHYSVRPDYFELARVPPDAIACYLMRQVYESTECLTAKRPIRGFDLSLFRERFAAAMTAQGCAGNA